MLLMISSCFFLTHRLTPSLIYCHSSMVCEDSAYGPSAIPRDAAGVGTAHNCGISAVDHV